MLKRPTMEMVKKYKDADGLGERLLMELFTEKFPLNTNVEEVEIKIKMLNVFYRTQVAKTSLEAEMIVAKGIDAKLRAGDLSVVTDITRVDWVNGDKHYCRNNYCFATKYCSFHRPDIYPMFDAYICNMLKKYQSAYSFTLLDITDAKMKDYLFFAAVINDFKTFFRLTGCSVKSIDMFLWQYGKEC